MNLVLALLLAANASTPFLDEAKRRYVGLDFEGCLEQLQHVTADATADERVDAHLYSGLCELNLSRRDDAAEQFRAALTLDDAAQLPPYSSARAQELFAQVKRSLDEAQRPRPATDDSPLATELLPRPKPADRVPMQPSLRWKTHAPSLGLGVGAVISAVMGLGLGLHAKALEQQANHARFDVDFVAYGRAAKDNAVAANVAWALAGAALTTAFVLLVWND